jgi:RNA polymerase sigma factor (sigma-70 family)
MKPHSPVAPAIGPQDQKAPGEAKSAGLRTIDSEEAFRRLLAKAKAGDQLAFVTLMDYCGPSLRKQARHWHSRRLQSKFGDSDMMQEAHLRALAAIKDFRGISEGEFKAWLLTILDNVAKALARYYKAAKRDAARETAAPLDHGSMDSLLDDVFSPDPTPLEAVQRKDVEDYLRQFGNQLLEKQRQVFSLFLWDGLSFVEIASRLALPLQEVHVIYHEVIQKVKRHLKNYR